MKLGLCSYLCAHCECPLSCACTQFWLHGDVVVTMDPTHTRYKVWWMKLW